MKGKSSGIQSGPTDPSSESRLRLRELEAAIAPAAERLGLDVYLVGGAVRDLLEGRPLSGEWDVVVMGGEVTGARDLAGELARLWEWRDPVPFEKYGTYLVSGPEGPLEISQCGLRSSLVPRSDDPLVGDALTRDFTLNALYVRLDGRGAGKARVEVLDPSRKGLADLEAGLLRTPDAPEPIFRDDPARILRAARLCATRGYRTCSPLSRAANNLSRLLVGVSHERVRDEMHKLLLGQTPSAGLRRLADWGAFGILMPEIHAMVGFRQRTPHHYPDLFRHTMRVVDRTPPDLPLRWAALLHDIGKPGTRTVDGDVDRYFGHEATGAELAGALLERLRVGKQTRAVATDLIRLHMVHYTSRWSERAVRRFIARCGENLPLLMDLLEADARSLRIRADKLRSLKELRGRVETVRRIMPPIRPPIDGRRIMELLEIEPGPEVGRATALLTDALTDGLITEDPEEAERYLLREWRGPGGKRP